MKELTSYNRTVQYLNKVFKLINAEYFNDTLEMPAITIQSTVGAYGHVITSKVWTNDKGNASYELNKELEYFKSIGVRVKVIDIPSSMIDIAEGQEWIIEMINNILIEALTSITEQQLLQWTGLILLIPLCMLI